MFVWLLSLSILPLLTFAIFGCGKNRETAHKQSDKSKLTDKSGKSVKSNKTQKSNKSKKSKKSQKSKKSGKSTKSKSKKGKKATASAKSKKAVKSGKSSKSAKSGKSAKTATSISAKSSKGSNKNQFKIDAAVKADQNAAALASKPAPIESKPLELRTEPKEMTYKTSGGIQSFNVVNNTNEARVFKVKCSDNQLYRVHPVYQIVEGGQTGKIEVLRQNGAPKTDKLVLVSVKADAAFGDARTMFSQGSAQPQHMLAVPLIVDA